MIYHHPLAMPVCGEALCPNRHLGTLLTNHIEPSVRITQHVLLSTVLAVAILFHVIINHLFL